jgi:hypothetical protein
LAAGKARSSARVQEPARARFITITKSVSIGTVTADHRK